MKNPPTFRLAALCLPAVLTAGCAKPAAVAPTTQTAGGMTIQMTTNPSPPHTGDDTLILTLTDAATGAPVGNANITATAAMVAPRLPGSPASGRAQGNGRYEVPLSLGVATRYEVQVQIERTGQPPTAITLPLDVEH